jgi:hypothetical protein
MTRVDVQRPFNQPSFLSRLLLLTLVSLLSQSCSGDKHLPSSNPPEYDPNKVFTPPASSHGSSPQGAQASDNPLAAGTVVPDPCEKQPKKLQKPNEPPIVCGGGAGRDGEPIAGGRGGDGSEMEPRDASAKHPSYVLEFQSRIVDHDDMAPAVSVAAGKVVLTSIEGKEGWYRGSGTLGYQTGPPPNRDPCSSLIMGHGTTRLDVAGMFIKLTERIGPAGNQVSSVDIELHYLIHPTNETERPVAYPDGQCVPGKPLALPFFYAKYAVSRDFPEINLLKDWTYVGKDGVVATKTLRGNCGDFCEDVTVFTLKEAEDSQ